MTEAMAVRKKINEEFAAEGVKVSPNDLVIKAVAADADIGDINNR